MLAYKLCFLLAVMAQSIMTASAYVAGPYNAKDFTIVTDKSQIALGSTLKFQFAGQKNKIRKFTLERYESKNGFNAVRSVVVDTLDNPNQEGCRDDSCTLEYEFKIAEDLKNHQPYFIQADIVKANDKSSEAFMIYNANSQAFITNNIDASGFTPSPSMFEFESTDSNYFCYNKDIKFTLKTPSNDYNTVSFKRYDGPRTGTGDGFSSIDLSSHVILDSSLTGTINAPVPENKDTIVDYPYFVIVNTNNSEFKSNLFFMKEC